MGDDLRDRHAEESEPRTTACSAADIRAFFGVEPDENIDDEHEEAQDAASPAVGTTVQRFRLTAAEPESGSRKSSNVPTKTTTVFVKLNTDHDTTPARCTNGGFSCKSEDQSTCHDSETNRCGTNKTSNFVFTANAGCTNEAFLGDDPGKPRCAEAIRCGADKTSLVTSQTGTPSVQTGARATGERHKSSDNAAFSVSKPLEVNGHKQKSPHEVSAVRDETSRGFAPVPMTHLTGVSHKNSSSESNVGHSRSCTDTNSDCIKDEAIPSPERSDEKKVAQTGVAQIGVLERTQDAGKDLYPMFDEDTSSIDGIEADRDLNEIWTVSVCV